MEQFDKLKQFTNEFLTIKTCSFAEKSLNTDTVKLQMKVKVFFFFKCLIKI